MKIKRSLAALFSALALMLATPAYAYALETPIRFPARPWGFLPVDFMMLSALVLLVGAIVAAIVANVRLRRARRLACRANACSQRRPVKGGSRADLREARAAAAASRPRRPGEERRKGPRREMDRSRFGEGYGSVEDDASYFSSMETPRELRHHSVAPSRPTGSNNSRSGRDRRQQQMRPQQQQTQAGRQGSMQQRQAPAQQKTPPRQQEPQRQLTSNYGLQYDVLYHDPGASSMDLTLEAVQAVRARLGMPAEYPHQQRQPQKQLQPTSEQQRQAQQFQSLTQMPKQRTEPQQQRPARQPLQQHPAHQPQQHMPPQHQHQRPAMQQTDPLEAFAIRQQAFGDAQYAGRHFKHTSPASTASEAAPAVREVYPMRHARASNLPELDELMRKIS